MLCLTINDPAEQDTYPFFPKKPTTTTPYTYLYTVPLNALQVTHPKWIALTQLGRMYRDSHKIYDRLVCGQIGARG